MALDPMRRRLTVSQCDVVKEVASAAAGEEDLPEDCPVLAKIVDEACAANVRAAAVSSRTDADGHGRRPFGEKDAGVRRTFASDDEALNWVRDTVGFACKKGKKPEHPNQDSFSVVIVEGQFSLYCVYDGHGPNGHHISQSVQQNIVEAFLEHPERDVDAEKAFHDVFAATQRQIEEDSQRRGGDLDAAMSGTTCTMVYHNVPADLLTTAHVGDSRCVLGRASRKDPGKIPSVLDITIDHKPNLDAERARIESASPPGRVVFDGYHNHRVYAAGGALPGLNMSRAIGDVMGHMKAGLTAMPDVKTIDLGQERKGWDALALLVCTDGVWEFIDSKKAMRMVFTDLEKGASPTKAMERLVKEGWDAWMKDSDNEISDDITGLLVRL
mmetsp:Transcript_55568/g.157817  ORF Transcript_55568/g.157817 Transcript_55568/m.157817 type:complete len:384 (-) Transcript_55568:48-1199(-)